MHKPTLLAGLVTIAVMCLYPPWEVEDSNQGRHAGADATTEVRSTNGTSSRVRHPSTTIMHRGLIMSGEWGSPDGNHAYTAQIHTERLLLQIAVVALIFGMLAYMIGPPQLSEAKVREKVREYDQNIYDCRSGS